MKRALISVSDKTGLISFAKRLADMGVEIISSGGTFRALTEQGIPAIEVSKYTGSPEIMDGRVKTLHPKIHGGILGRRGTDDHLGVPYIDLVVVNLYPFEQEQIIENIDIGGPTLLRASAKNHQYVGVVVDPNDYPKITGALSDELRLKLATKAFWHIAHYDTVIANYFGSLSSKESNFPETITYSYRKHQDLRYGENPHQQAAFYVRSPARPASFANAKQLQGKELSFNNLLDADAAWKCVIDFKEPTCVIVKHGNPCGVASAKDLKTAYEQAHACDPTSAFGGIIAFNRTLDESTLDKILQNQFVEVIIAPKIEEKAEVLAKTKPNIRVIVWEKEADWQKLRWELREVFNGDVLAQTHDMDKLGQQDMKVVTDKAPTKEQWQDLLFAWKVAKYVKSNAIVYVKDNQTIGVGAGQMSRVDSVKIAVSKAHEANLSLEGAVLASDAFFPFADGIELAIKEGVKAVIQPGGSQRDSEVIAAANRAGIAMVFTGMRHFRH